MVCWKQATLRKVGLGWNQSLLQVEAKPSWSPCVRRTVWGEGHGEEGRLRQQRRIGDEAPTPTERSTNCRVKAVAVRAIDEGFNEKEKHTPKVSERTEWRRERIEPGVRRGGRWRTSPSPVDRPRKLPSEYEGARFGQRRRYLCQLMNSGNTFGVNYHTCTPLRAQW